MSEIGPGSGSGRERERGRGRELGQGPGPDTEADADGDRETVLGRRRLLRAGAVALPAALAGCAGGGGGGGGAGSGDSGGGDDGDGGGQRFDGYLAAVTNFESVVDRTDRSEVEVVVGSKANGGNFGYTPAAVRVATGTTVVWRWNGKGGAHNVIAEDGTFGSGLTAQEGHTFEYTFEEAGTYKYYCRPHRTVNMKGVVVVTEG
jgi:halocyanin-like protein